MRVLTATRCFIFKPSFPSKYNNINPSFFKPLLNIPIEIQTQLGFCTSPISTPPPIMSSPPRRVIEVREKIDLNDKEIKIFNRLRDVLTHFQLSTQLRVAGGWVRDKV